MVGTLHGFRRKLDNEIENDFHLLHYFYKKGKLPFLVLEQNFRLREKERVCTQKIVTVSYICLCSLATPAACILLTFSSSEFMSRKLQYLTHCHEKLQWWCIAHQTHHLNTKKLKQNLFRMQTLLELKCKLIFHLNKIHSVPLNIER